MGKELTLLWNEVRAMTTEQLKDTITKMAKRKAAKIWSPRDELAALEYARRMNAAQPVGAVRS